MFCLLLVDIEIVAGDLSVYRASFATSGAPARTGLTVDQLTEVTERVLDYSTGRRPDLQFDLADLDGGTPGRPAFTVRELRHMVDVRDLFAQAQRLRWVFLGLAAGLALIVLAFERLSHHHRTGCTLAGRSLARGYLLASSLFILLWAVLSVMALVSFTEFWDAFHLRLFDNDLWLLPRGSLLIEMLPESLFQSLALRVVGLLTAQIVLIMVLSGLYLRCTAGHTRAA